MNRRLIFLILLLVAFCLCCASSGFLGRRLPTFRQIDLQAPSLQQLRQRLTIRLKGSDLTLMSGTGCTAQDENLSVPQGTTCVFAIRTSDRFTRQLVLALQSPAISVDVQLTQPKAISVDSTPAPGNAPFSLDIYANSDRPFADVTLQNCQMPKSKTPLACVLKIIP